MDILSKINDAKEVFRYFEEISKIPHGSGDTTRIADYLISFANERGLYARRDEKNNVVIKKCATEGLSDRPAVIIQGHTDMVHAKSEDYRGDLSKDGLDLYIDGDFLRARGTTLGGDDGVAVAYALALLDSKDIPHPAIEAIFTSDEEIGLLGVSALDTSDIDARIMINIDSDAEGVFTAGCAGGMRIDVSMPAKLSVEKESIKLSIFGLKGGHSGIEIGNGRLNAIKTLASLLGEINAPISIGAISGGNADNAIPRSAECLISAEAKEEIKKLIPVFVEKLKGAEPDICILAEDFGNAELYSKEDSEKIISLINEEPSGVVKMSEDVPGLVETSLNLGIICSSENGVSLAFSVRSAKGDEKKKLATRVTKIAESYGATHGSHGDYPAWEYRCDSHLREVMCDVYKKQYGTDAKVIIIHAGLECGIFSEKLPGLDCISIGPDNFDIHTTEERLSISSTIRVWNFLLEVLKSI